MFCFVCLIPFLNIYLFTSLTWSLIPVHPSQSLSPFSFPLPLRGCSPHLSLPTPVYQVSESSQGSMLIMLVFLFFLSPVETSVLSLILPPSLSLHPMTILFPLLSEIQASSHGLSFLVNLFGFLFLVPSICLKKIYDAIILNS